MTYNDWLGDAGAQLDEEFEALHLEIEELRETLEETREPEPEVPRIDPEIIDALERRLAEVESHLEELEDRPTPTPGPGTGTGSGVDERLAAALWTAFDPVATDTLPTGPVTGEPHYGVGWGPVYTVDELVQFRGAMIGAADTGEITFEILKIDGDDPDADIDGIHAVRTIEITRPGIHYIPIETSLEPGSYHIRKDFGADPNDESIVGLRRIENADRSTINDSDIPVEWVRGWHVDYRPRYEASYGRFEAGNWGDNYHYLFQPEFGYGVRYEIETEAAERAAAESLRSAGENASVEVETEMPIEHTLGPSQKEDIDLDLDIDLEDTPEDARDEDGDGEI